MPRPRRVAGVSSPARNGPPSGSWFEVLGKPESGDAGRCRSAYRGQRAVRHRRSCRRPKRASGARRQEQRAAACSMRPAAVFSRTSSLRLQPVRSFDYEPVVALEIAYRRDALGAVDLVEVAEEVGLAIGGFAEAVQRPRKLLARDRLDEVGRDDDDELAFLFDEVA